MNILNSATIVRAKRYCNWDKHRIGKKNYISVTEESSGFSEQRKNIEPGISQRSHTLYPHVYFLVLSMINAFDPKFILMVVSP